MIGFCFQSTPARLFSTGVSLCLLGVQRMSLISSRNVSAVLLSLMIAATGCGGGDDDKDRSYSDEEKVSGVIDISDVVSKPEEFKAAFVDGAAPEDATLYKGHSFAASDASVSGDSATITVVIRKVSTGKIVGEKDWTAQKVGDSWKLKSAPMPGG